MCIGGAPWGWLLASGRWCGVVVRRGAGSWRAPSGADAAHLEGVEVASTDLVDGGDEGVEVVVHGHMATAEDVTVPRRQPDEQVDGLVGAGTPAVGQLPADPRPDAVLVGAGRHRRRSLGRDPHAQGEEPGVHAEHRDAETADLAGEVL